MRLRTLLFTTALLTSTSDAVADEFEDPPERELTQHAEDPYLDRSATSGLGLNLRVAAVSTLRRMNLAGTDRTVEHRPGLFVGGAVHATQRLVAVSERSVLGAEVVGMFGSGRDTKLRPNRRPLTTEHVLVTARVLFDQSLHRDVDLRLGLGFNGESFTIERNSVYTGHRYLALLASIGVTYWATPRVNFGGELTFLPGIDTNQSGGGYGAARSFGGRAGALATWRFFQPTAGDLFGVAEFVARYSWSRYQTTMPETQAFGDLGHTADTAHAVSLGIAYNL